jgi:hypothetical protein
VGFAFVAVTGIMTTIAGQPYNWVGSVTDMADGATSAIFF